MKILIPKTAVRAAVVIPLFALGSTFALTLTDINTVGTVQPGTPASPADDLVYVNTLLGLSGSPGTVFANFTDTVGTHTYTIGGFDYAGLVSGPGVTIGKNDALPTSGDYLVIAKYAGGSGNPHDDLPSVGGDVVLVDLGGTLVLPQTGESLFMNAQGKGYGLSGATYFSFVPGEDVLLPPNGGPSVPDGGATALLLGGGVTALAFLRRKLS